jgi:hypothetical protein
MQDAREAPASRLGDVQEVPEEHAVRPRAVQRREVVLPRRLRRRPDLHARRAGPEINGETGEVVNYQPPPVNAGALHHVETDADPAGGFDTGVDLGREVNAPPADAQVVPERATPERIEEVVGVAQSAVESGALTKRKLGTMLRAHGATDTSSVHAALASMTAEAVEEFTTDIEVASAPEAATA